MAEYMFFSKAHKLITKMYYMWNHITRSSQFKRMEIIQCTFFDPNKSKIGINNSKTIGKFPNI